MTLSKNSDGTITLCCCDTDPCPAPACANCNPVPSTAKCPPCVQINAEDMQNANRWDITSNGWPTTDLPDTGSDCLEFEISSVGPAFTDVFVINYTSAADFESQLETALTTRYGGTWDVVVQAGSSPNTFQIVSVNGLATGLNPDPVSIVDPAEFIVFECGGAELTNNLFTGVIVQNCAQLITNHPLTASGGIPIPPDAPCVFEYSEFLGGDCNLDMVVTVNLTPTGILLRVELLDNVGTVLSFAEYQNSLTAPYNCDTDYFLGTVSSFDNGTPVLADWANSSANWLGL